MTAVPTSPSRSERVTDDASAPRLQVRARSVARWVVAVALALTGGAVLWAERAIRDAELLVAQALAEFAFASESAIATRETDPALAFTAGAGWYVMQVPFAAGLAPAVAALALSSAILTFFARRSVLVSVVLSVIGLAMVVMGNQARLLLEGYALSATAQPGLHVIGDGWGAIASATVVVGVLAVLSFALFWRPRGASAASTTGSNPQMQGK